MSGGSVVCEVTLTGVSVPCPSVYLCVSLAGFLSRKGRETKRTDNPEPLKLPRPPSGGPQRSHARPWHWTHRGPAAGRHRWSTRATCSAARRQHTPLTTAAAPRWPAGAVKCIARLLPTAACAVEAGSRRWKAASGSVLAAPVEEICCSKPPAHTRDADPAR